MNGYERFMTALKGRQPDRVPLWELIVNEPTLTAWGATSLLEFTEAEDLDAITIFEDARLVPGERPGQVVDDWGITWGTTEFGIPYPETGPIDSTADLTSYRAPDPEDDFRLATLRAAVERFRGEQAVVFLTHDGFEYPHYLRGGMDRLLVDYIDNPDLAHGLAEMTVTYKTRLMELAIEAGADAMVSGDDYAGRHGPVMSPDHFREFVLPYLKHSVEAAHARGVPYIKHTDGNLWPLMDMMVDEAGIDAIDPIEPIADMDIGEMKARYGARIALIGNVDCTELLTHGTPADVEEAVKETIAKAGPRGGYIMASSNSLHPAVRPQNYRAMEEATRRWGRYPLDEEMVSQYVTRDYMNRWRRGDEAPARPSSSSSPAAGSGT